MTLAQQHSAYEKRIDTTTFIQDTCGMLRGLMAIRLFLNLFLVDVWRVLIIHIILVRASQVVIPQMCLALAIHFLARREPIFGRLGVDPTSAELWHKQVDYVLECAGRGHVS